jgi:hypothetical protein
MSHFRIIFQSTKETMMIKDAVYFQNSLLIKISLKLLALFIDDIDILYLLDWWLMKRVINQNEFICLESTAGTEFTSRRLWERRWKDRIDGHSDDIFNHRRNHFGEDITVDLQAWVRISLDQVRI